MFGGIFHTYVLSFALVQVVSSGQQETKFWPALPHFCSSPQPSSRRIAMPTPSDIVARLPLSPSSCAMRRIASPW